MLLDVVGRDGKMAADLLLVPADVRVYQIAAEPCRCNSFGSGSEVLEEQRQGQFIGVRLVGGTRRESRSGWAVPLLSAWAGRWLLSVALAR